MGGWTQQYNLLATAAFVLVSAAVATRLLLLARRTRERPELLLGLGILGTAVLGYGLMIASLVMRGGAPVAQTIPQRALHGAGEIAHDLGVTMIVLFVASVFRARERWARALAGVMLASLWSGLLGVELANRFRETGITGGGFWWLRYAVIWSYSVWMAIESFAYWRQMKRRVALGLAEPLVANRFLLWGLASLGTTLATWSASIPFFLARDPELALAWQGVIQTGTATVGLATVGIYALTFFPPAAYRRRVARAG
jgi:hypothetical protein